jgi:hypothetical protein
MSLKGRPTGMRNGKFIQLLGHPEDKSLHLLA